MSMLINGDNDVNFIFDVINKTPQLISVELYITITPQLIGVELCNSEDVQHANLEGYGGEDLQEDYNILTQPLTAPCYDIPTPLEERGGSNCRHKHLLPTLVDGCGPICSDEHEMDWRESQPKSRCGICHDKRHNCRTCLNVSMVSTSGAGTN